MRKKIKVIFWKKTYLFWEVTVWGYWASIEEPTQFREELFLEFNDEVLKLNEKQTKVLYAEVFGIEKHEFLFKTKIQNNTLDDFHINIWIFMKFFGISYWEVMKMPLRIFNKMFEDMWVISWKETYDKNRKSHKPDREKIKNIITPNYIKNV